MANSCASVSSLYPSRIWSISSGLLNLGIRLFILFICLMSMGSVMTFSYSFGILVICILSFVRLAGGLLILSVFKEPNFGFIDFSVLISCSVSLISALITFFFLLTFDLNCFPYSFLRQMPNLFHVNLSCYIKSQHYKFPSLHVAFTLAYLVGCVFIFIQCRCF